MLQKFCTKILSDVSLPVADVAWPVSTRIAPMTVEAITMKALMTMHAMSNALYVWGTTKRAA